MEQDKSMTGFGRLSEKGKMKVAPYNLGFSVMQQHLSISKPFMQELLIYQFSNCCRQCFR
jgi:hypothetical protein